jgi:hypothetical protein
MVSAGTSSDCVVQVAFWLALIFAVGQSVLALPLISHETFPEGAVGVKNALLNAAVKVTAVPAATEFPGNAEMESVGVSAVTVYDNPGEVAAVKFVSPEYAPVIATLAAAARAAVVQVA